jgi:hypothetical protein
MSKINTVAILGAGVIGASWSALFLAAGFRVRVYDPADSDGAKLRACIDNAWPALRALDMTANGNPDNFSLHPTAAEAVEGAQFVQESVPERLELKHRLYAEIEPALLPQAIVSSSASGLLVREMQLGLLEFCDRYRDSFQRWWDDLDDVRLDDELAQSLFDGVNAEAGGAPVAQAAAARDALIVEFLRSRKALATQSDKL